MFYRKQSLGAPDISKMDHLKMNVMHCKHRERKSLSSSTSFHKNSWIHLNFIALIKLIIDFLQVALPRRSTDSNGVSRIQAISFLFICIAK